MRGPSVTSRVLAILTTFDDAHRAQTLSQIARRAALPTTTAHRILTELCEGNALQRDEDGLYTIGAGLWRVAMLAGHPAGLREIASPFLHDIYATTLATVHLAVREGTSAVYLARLAGHRSVPILSAEGGRSPLHSTAVGKVLLAHAPLPIANEVMHNLTRQTSRTISQPGILAQQLAKVREQGYALSHEEMSVGAHAVAVPIFADDEVVAALGAAVDTSALDQARLLTALRIASRGISRSLKMPFRSPEKSP